MKRNILLITILFLVINMNFTYSKYNLEMTENVLINSEKFYFDVVVENSRKDRFDLIIRNYMGDLYTDSNIKYSIYTYDNNYLFSINNSEYNNKFIREINGNKKSIDNLSVKLKNSDNSNIKFIINVYEPYTKTFSFEI